MRPLKNLVCTVGVALCVAPIFSSAWAQQSGAGSIQSNLLLEVQQLRAEIAELRDMVERQQYQLKKMQGASSSATNRVPGGAYNAPAQNYPSDVGQNASATVNQYQSAPQNTLPYADQPTVQNQGQNQGLYQTQQPYQGGSPSIDAASPNAGSSAYPAQPAANFPASTEASRVVDGVVIEERSIGGAGVAPYEPGTRVIPPVEERPIGARPVDDTAVFRQNPANSAATDRRLEPIQNGTSPATNGQPSRQAISNGFPTTARPMPIANSRVIAVPTASTGAVAVVGAGVAAASVNNPESSQQAAPIPTAAPEQPPRRSENSFYQQGFELLKQEKHAQAVAMFKQQIANYPQGGFADDAHYWIAESMYVNRQLDDSKKYFRAIIDNFKQSPRLPDAMLKTAYIEQGQGNVMEARILLQGIVQYHPRSDAAIAAKNRLADLN